MYNLLTLVLGIPLSLAWGILFAIISFTMVWMVTPSYQVFKICIQSIRSFHSVTIHTILGPFYEVAALLLSRINITINAPLSSINNAILAIEDKQISGKYINPV